MEKQIKFTDLEGKEQIATIHHLYGKVLEINGSTETNISGSGGGSNIDPLTHRTYIEPVNIKTKSTKKLEIFLRDNNGKEKLIKLTNWNVSLRAGHHLDFVWATCNNNSTPYFIINNLTLNKYWYNYNNLNCIIENDKKFFYTSRYKDRELKIMLIIVGILWLVSFVLLKSFFGAFLLMCLPALLIWYFVVSFVSNQAKSAYSKQIKERKDKFIKELQPHILTLDD